MSRAKTQAPKGRNNPAQGNAQGNAIPEDQSPEPERSGDRSPTGDRVAVNEVNQRAGHLPEGWRWVTLKEIANIAGGVTKGQKRRPSEVIRKVPYLRVANVQRGYLDLSEVKEIEASESEIEALKLQAGDILFNEGGDRDKLGRGWIWNDELPECVHQNHVFRARLKNTEDQPKFISFYGNSEGQRYFMEQGKQTTNLASINLTKLGALPIPLPPPDDQRRIVAEIEKQFTRLEAGVAALRRAQANLKRYRAAVLKAACEGRLVPTEVDWKQVKIDSVIEAMDQGWSPKCESEASVDENTWAVIKTTAIQHLRFLEVENKALPATLKPRSHLELKPGDLLVTRAGPRSRVGVACLIKNTRPGLMLCDKAYRIRCKQENVVPGFLELTLNAPHIIDEVNKLKTGISDSGVNLTQKGFAQLIIPLPPLAEQTRIVAEVERRLSVVEELEAVVTTNLQRATRLRQAVLQKAFAGEL